LKDRIIYFTERWPNWYVFFCKVWTWKWWKWV